LRAIATDTRLTVLSTSERAKSNFLRVDQLFAAADRLAAQDLPPLTEVEVETEIQAARSPRRTSKASRR
jgi:hypothetical protein